MTKCMINFPELGHSPSNQVNEHVNGSYAEVCSVRGLKNPIMGIRHSKCHGRSPEQKYRLTQKCRNNICRLEDKRS